MSDFLKNPQALFDVKGKVAVITGASGAFGALAAKILAGAGCKLVISAGKKSDLDAVAKESAGLGAEVEALNMRPTTETLCNDVIAAGVKRLAAIHIN